MNASLPSETDVQKGDRPYGEDDWDRFTAYKCRSCRVNCINDFRSAAARLQECKSCITVPLLEDTDTTRVGEAEEVPGVAERLEATPSGADRKRGLAPDPEADPQEGPKGPKREAVADGGEDR